MRFNRSGSNIRAGDRARLNQLALQIKFEWCAARLSCYTRLAFPNNWNFGGASGDRGEKPARYPSVWGGRAGFHGGVRAWMGLIRLIPNWNEWRERSTLAVARNVKYRSDGGIDSMACRWHGWLPWILFEDKCVVSCFLGNTRNLAIVGIRSRLCPYGGTAGDEILVRRNWRIFSVRDIGNFLEDIQDFFIRILLLRWYHGDWKIVIPERNSIKWEIDNVIYHWWIKALLWIKLLRRIIYSNFVIIVPVLFHRDVLRNCLCCWKSCINKTYRNYTTNSFCMQWGNNEDLPCSCIAIQSRLKVAGIIQLGATFYFTIYFLHSSPFFSFEKIFNRNVHA